MEFREKYGKLDDEIIREFYERHFKSECSKGTNPSWNVNESYQKTLYKLKDNDAYIIHIIRFNVEYNESICGSNSTNRKQGVCELWVDNYGRILILDTNYGYQYLTFNDGRPDLYTNYKKKLSDKIIDQIKFVLNYNHDGIIFSTKNSSDTKIPTEQFYEEIKYIIENEEIECNKESNMIINLQNKIKELEDKNKELEDKNKELEYVINKYKIKKDIIFEYKIVDDNKQKVCVCGEFNNWIEEEMLYDEETRSYKISKKLSKGSYEYKFYINDEYVLNPNIETKVNKYGFINHNIVIE